MRNWICSFPVSYERDTVIVFRRSLPATRLRIRSVRHWSWMWTVCSAASGRFWLHWTTRPWPLLSCRRSPSISRLPWTKSRTTECVSFYTSKLNLGATIPLMWPPSITISPMRPLVRGPVGGPRGAGCGGLPRPSRPVDRQGIPRQGQADGNTTQPRSPARGNASASTIQHTKFMEIVMTYLLPCWHWIIIMLLSSQRFWMSAKHWILFG